MGKIGQVGKAGAVFQNTAGSLHQRTHSSGKDLGEKALSRNVSIPMSHSTTPSAITIDRFPILKLPPPSSSHNAGPGFERRLHTKYDLSSLL